MRSIFTLLFLLYEFTIFLFLFEVVCRTNAGCVKNWEQIKEMSMNWENWETYGPAAAIWPTHIQLRQANASHLRICKAAGSMADWAVLPAGSLSYRLCWEGPSSQPPLLLVVLVRQCSGLRRCECSGRETCSPYYTQCACWQARYYPVDLVEWVTCLTCLSRIHLHKKKICSLFIQEAHWG